MKMVKTTPFNFFDHPILKRDFSRLCLSLKWGMLIKVGKVAKMMGKVGSASFSKSNSLFNPSHAFWLTASIQILSRKYWARCAAAARSPMREVIERVRGSVLRVCFEGLLEVCWRSVAVLFT